MRFKDCSSYSALSLREAVRRLQPGTNPVVYGPIIQRCTAARAIDEGRRVHRVLAKQGCHKDIYIANLLIQMYGACGSIDEAVGAFDKLKHKNMYTWNTMLAAYARSGHLSEAKVFFANMGKRDQISWNAIVTVCSQSGSLDEAKLHFERMPQRCVVSWNTMLSALAKHGQLAEARRIFDTMVESMRSVPSWNAMIQAYVKHGDLEEAKGLFDEMRTRDHVTYTTMIQAYASERMMEEAESVFAMMGDDPDLVSCTAMVSGYGCIGDLRSAEKMFGMIRNPDTVAWNALLQAYAQNGFTDEARQVFDTMPQRNLSSWNSMITAFAVTGQSNEAKALFDQMRERNVITNTAMVQAYALAGRLQEARILFDESSDRNVVTWTTMITAYAQKGQCALALSLFLAMDLDGVRPTPITYVSVFAACASVDALRRGRVIHVDLVQRGVPVEVCVSNALVHMYARGGQLGEARRVFDSLSYRDVVAWNTMLAAYAKAAEESHRAIELFALMALDGGCDPDAITFVVVLFACSHRGLLAIARGHFASLGYDYGQRAGVEHFVCMIDLLARAGQIARAEELIQSMPYEPDEVAYTALAVASKGHGHASNASDRARNALQISPDRASPYILLSQATRQITRQNGAHRF